MKRAVFDTNVLVAGFLSPHGPPGRLVEWLRKGQIQAVLDDRIAQEYAEVLVRPKFRLPPTEVAVVLTAILDAGFRVEPAAEHQAGGLPDPYDAPFLECARAAEVPLVTGNTRHFPAASARGVRVLSPAEFVRELGP